MSTLVDAIASAEARALLDHESGACAESEWSCSHCETERLRKDARP